MRVSTLTQEATQRLYHEDAYQREFGARVVDRLEVHGAPAVVLDRTAFYPTAGGQPHDTGTINGVTVLDVREDGQRLVHVVERAIESDSVRGRIDWSRRFDHMQQHTGQHVLSQACKIELGARTVGFHLGAELSTIDLDKDEPTDRDLASAEALANRVVTENRPVTSRVVSADQAALARIRGKAEGLTSVRLVEIDDFDLSGCGGTHVRTTAEIGTIKVLSGERHRGGSTRVTFLCGGRAFDDYRRKHRLLRDLVSTLTTGEEELVAVVQGLETAQAQLRSRERQLRQALLDREATALLADARTAGNSQVVTAVYESEFWDADSVRALATRIAAEPRAVALLGWEGGKSQLTFVRGSGAEGNMGALMKAACAALGGRGGGRPDWAQGGCSGNVALREVLEHAYNSLAAEAS